MSLLPRKLAARKLAASVVLAVAVVLGTAGTASARGLTDPTTQPYYGPAVESSPWYDCTYSVADNAERCYARSMPLQPHTIVERRDPFAAIWHMVRGWF
jgi:hypothetical protein